MTRKSVAAGRFYPSDPAELRGLISSMVTSGKEKEKCAGAVVPHAGYVYSGQIAADVYSRIAPPDTYIIFGPDHTGMGGRFTASSEAWQTPLGNVDADARLISSIISMTGLVEDDPSAHTYEHSIEVQLPFIQYISPEAKIVPIMVGASQPDELRRVSDAVARCVRDAGRSIVILASSDMTHYEPRSSAGTKDRKAIEKMKGLDAEGLIELVREENITMCGYMPAALMLMTAKQLGASRSFLTGYADSGSATGNTDQVVGYAGMITDGGGA